MTKKKDWTGESFVRRTNDTPLTADQKRLVEENVRLAYKFGRKASEWSWVQGRMTRDEVTSSALLGLTCAARKFNPEKGYKFSTYANLAMTNMVLRDAHEAQIVRVPAYKKHKSRPHPFAEAVARASAVLSMNECSRGGPAKADLTPFCRSPSPEAVASRKEAAREARRACWRVLRILTKDQRRAARLVWRRGLTQAQAAEVLGVCHQAVASRLKGARRTIRRAVEEGRVRGWAA